MNYQVNGNVFTFASTVKRVFKAEIRQVLLTEVGFLILLEPTLPNNVMKLTLFGGLGWRLKALDHVSVLQALIQEGSEVYGVTSQGEYYRINLETGALEKYHKYE